MTTRRTEQGADESPRCEHEGCTKVATYEIPRHLCDWHWCLWLCYGDVKEAKRTMKELELEDGNA